MPIINWIANLFPAHGAKLRRINCTQQCASASTVLPPVHHNAPLRRRFIRQNRADAADTGLKCGPVAMANKLSTNHSPMFYSCRMCPLRWIFQSFMTAARFMFGSYGVCNVTILSLFLFPSLWVAFVPHRSNRIIDTPNTNHHDRFAFFGALVHAFWRTHTSKTIVHSIVLQTLHRLSLGIERWPLFSQSARENGASQVFALCVDGKAPYIYFHNQGFELFSSNLSIFISLEAAETALASPNGVLLVILYVPDAVLNGWLASIVSSRPVAMALALNHRLLWFFQLITLMTSRILGVYRVCVCVCIELRFAFDLAVVTKPFWAIVRQKRQKEQLSLGWPAYAYVRWKSRGIDDIRRSHGFIRSLRQLGRSRCSVRRITLRLFTFVQMNCCHIDSGVNTRAHKKSHI